MPVAPLPSAFSLLPERDLLQDAGGEIGTRSRNGDAASIGKVGYYKPVATPFRLPGWGVTVNLDWLAKAQRQESRL
jgi:hypothetical protein